ncbi:MAG: lytic transglycosylase [Pseudomonadota bacterium]
MSKFLRALILVLLAASCGGGQSAAPRNLDNACALLRERPSYARAFRKVERKWDVPVHVLMATMHQESKFIANARTPFRYTLGVIPMGRQSSAYGYSQALDGTWDEYRQKQNQRGARRNRISDASDFMGWYFNETQRRNGVALDDTRNQYLAYHEGHTGFARGSYTRKSWLVNISRKVEARAEMYEGQLQGCRLRL